jgi:hypothetical protein
MLSANSIKWHHAFSAGVGSTAALIKFCEEHDRPVPQLRAVLDALEADDRRAAAEAFHSIPFGGMMCFNDWFPPAKLENETPEYVSEVFEALTERWYRLAKLLLQ